MTPPEQQKPVENCSICGKRITQGEYVQARYVEEIVVSEHPKITQTGESRTLRLAEVQCRDCWWRK